MRSSVLALSMLLAGMCVGWYLSSKYAVTGEAAITAVMCDTVWCHDTVRYVADVRETSRVSLGKVERRVARASVVSQCDTSAGIHRDSTSLRVSSAGADACSCDSGVSLLDDSVDVMLDVCQRIYVSESYKAWVSGIEARLDSIHVYRRDGVVSVSRGCDREKRWGLGIQVGCGLGRGGVTPYVGVGVSYNILMW